ncbi:MAG: Fic family protein [Candidatus Pacearchaeota archaeon]
MRIIKRKKGSREYYYIQYSFRKENKVITKEKYLGKEIPKNIEEIKKEINKELKNELIEKLEKIKENFQEEWERIPESAKKKEKEEISIAFTYNTNAIEGSTITLEETREIIHDKISPNKLLRDVKETESHSKVFLEMLDKKEKLNEELILKWHYEIFKDVKKDIAGKYREYLVRVGDYLAPDWQDVKKLMKELFEFIKEYKKKINPIELAGIIHYRFEKIHPFGDGNGRIGRLLMNYIIWYANYPMIIIEYKKRKSYYKAFKKDEAEFVNYFIRRYLTIHKKRIA